MSSPALAWSGRHGTRYGQQGTTGWAGRCAALAALTCLLVPLDAQAGPAPTEPQVKAAFIYNFAQFVQWPTAPQTPGAVTVCLLGTSALGNFLSALSGRPVGGATLRVRTVAGDQPFCNILVIPDGEADQLPAALEKSRGGHVLIVGETPGLAERGAAINLFLEQNRVRFEVNIDAANRAGLAISSQLLRLARIVHDRS
jgi:hypothetical protein